MVADQLVTR